jgi:hypothetical protein
MLKISELKVKTASFSTSRAASAISACRAIDRSQDELKLNDDAGKLFKRCRGYPNPKVSRSGLVHLS